MMNNSEAKPEKSFLPSVIALVVSNLVPVFGVLFLGWEAYPLMLLFWIENVLIGIFNVLKMLFCSPDNPAVWMGKLFIVPFFTVHYGIFTFVHGVFVMFVFNEGMRSASFPNAQAVWDTIRREHLIWGIVGLAVSHAISFATNYIGRGEYKQASLSLLMMQPYGRVMVLHVTIIIGGALMMALNSPTFGLLLLMALKIALDVRSHLREHRKYVAKPEERRVVTTV